MKKYDGMTAVIMHKKRILLLKRRNVPIILNPGIWALLSGARDGRERHIETAYREIAEESGIPRASLRLLWSAKIMLMDKNRGVMWPNRLFIFRSDTSKVRLDYENSGFRWATFRQIENQINYTNTIINEKRLLRMIKRYIYE